MVQDPINVVGKSPANIFREIVRVNQPEFLGSQTNEDPLNLVDDIKKIIEVMHAIGNNRVEFSSYQSKDVSHIWYTQRKENRGTAATPSTLDFLLRPFLTSLSRES